MDKETYDQLHKQLVDNCSPFSSIFSAIGRPSYNIAKFLVSILKPLTTNDYTLKDTFEFSRDILNQNPKHFVASLDVDSLFTDTPSDKSINIIIEKLTVLLFKLTINPLLAVFTRIWIVG